MESRGLSNARVSTREPIDSASARTGLGVDAIGTALIENLHCLQGNCHSMRRATTGTWRSRTPFATA
jgi:hypothetical protein